MEDLQNELLLKDKEIALLISHCDSLVQKSNTLQLLNDFESILDENRHLYDHIDQLNKKITLHSNELKEFTTNMEELISVNNKEQDRLQKLVYSKDDEFKLLYERLMTSKKICTEQEELITKQNDELLELNFIIYNKNKEIYYLKNQIEINNKEFEEVRILNAQYGSLINEIKEFIENQSQCIPIFNPSKIVENLMLLFNQKILGTVGLPNENSIPKGRKMKKKLDNRS